MRNNRDTLLFPADLFLLRRAPAGGTSGQDEKWEGVVRIETRSLVGFKSRLDENRELSERTRMKEVIGIYRLEDSQDLFSIRVKRVTRFIREFLYISLVSLNLG